MLNAIEVQVENGRIDLASAMPSWADYSNKVIVLLSKSESPRQNDEAISGALLSEKSLAIDWLRPEEDAAWAHLQ
jgi:hypothetical protein